MYWRNEYAASHKIHFCKHNTFGDFLLLYNSDELGYSTKITGKLDILYCTQATGTGVDSPIKKPISETWFFRSGHA